MLNCSLSFAVTYEECAGGMQVYSGVTDSGNDLSLLLSPVILHNSFRTVCKTMSERFNTIKLGRAMEFGVFGSVLSVMLLAVNFQLRLSCSHFIISMGITQDGFHF